jgi:GAF domain-containing protein
MEYSECLRVFEEVGSALNSPIDTVELLELVAASVVKHFHALDGETVLVEDCSKDPRIQYPQACAREGIASMLTIPLVTRGQVIGVVRLSTSETRTFSAEEVQVLETVASFCASVVVHWMFQSIVRSVTQAVRSSLDLDAVLASILKVIAEDLRAKGCCIKLVSREGVPVQRAYSYGLSEEFVGKATVGNDPVLDQALKGSCVLVLDSHSDPRVPYRDEALREGVGSILYVPMMVRDVPVGAMCICTHRAYEFSEDEVHLLMGVGDQCAFAIRNAQMYAAAKARYHELADDFQRWFERYQMFPSEPVSTP